MKTSLAKSSRGQERQAPHKLNVIISCDVECWPDRSGVPGAAVGRAVAEHIFGNTRTSTDRGIEWQMNVLSRYGLRGVFFVEALFGTRGFERELSKVVESIVRNGHDAELHAHTEWLTYPADKAAKWESKQHLRAYSLAEQVEILHAAKESLEASGSGKTVAFRAGNFGANDDTLRAVGAVGLHFDSSYNAAFLGAVCEITAPCGHGRPTRVGDVWEYPVTCFHDRPGLDSRHVRPLQITAASSREMEVVLSQAHAHGLHTLVILTHSFEMTHFPAIGSRPPRAHRLNVRRFEHMCRFLAGHQEKFRVVTFRDILEQNLVPAHDLGGSALPSSSSLNFLLRGVQNLLASTVKW